MTTVVSSCQVGSAVKLVLAQVRLVSAGVKVAVTKAEGSRVGVSWNQQLSVMIEPV